MSTVRPQSPRLFTSSCCVTACSHPLQSAAPTASPTSSVSLRLPPSPEGKALGTPSSSCRARILPRGMSPKPSPRREKGDRVSGGRGPWSAKRSSLLKDLFRPFGPPSPGMPPASRASRPCADYDACGDLQLSFVLARPPMDLFRLASSAPSPCAEKARDLPGSCSAERHEPERRDVFRLEARGDCPQGWDPIRKALRAGCRNAAAGGEASLLLAACWVTFSRVLKPEYIPQRLLRLFTSSLHVAACSHPFSRLRRQLPQRGRRPTSRSIAPSSPHSTFSRVLKPEYIPQRLSAAAALFFIKIF